MNQNVHDPQDKLREADYLDNKAKDWERLAGECLTQRTRNRCLWDANQCRLAAVRRWKEAQAILYPELADIVRVGGIEVTQAERDEENYSDFQIPDRIKALLGEDAAQWV